MALYRRKPNVIEAVQFDPDVQPWPAGVDHIAIHQIDGFCSVPYPFTPTGMWGQAGFYLSSVRGGSIRIDRGDWLDVTDPQQARAITREEFEALYEPFPAKETMEARSVRLLRELLPEIRTRSDAHDHLVYIDPKATPDILAWTIAAAIYVLNDERDRRQKESADAVRRMGVEWLKQDVQKAKETDAS